MMLHTLARLAALLPLIMLIWMPFGAQGQAPASSRAIPVTDPGWTLAGDVRVETHLGREALRLASGTAYFPAQRFRDGIIEFDLAMSALRTFVAVRFRAQSPDVWEEIYLRPHRSGLPDAVQYAPAFAGGRSNWQLYHGPGETAAAALPHGEWLPVRIVVRDSRAALFLGGAVTPAFVVPRLAHGPREGFIGFWGFDASAERGKGYPSAISNVVVRPGVAAFEFPETPVEAPPPGIVTTWQVSQAFAPEAGPVRSLPAAIAAGPWRRAAADPSGLLPLDRVVTLPEKAARVATLARLTLRAGQAATVPFSFGFSDDASVFLNGRLLYSGVNGYSYNFPRRDGLITGDQATLHLSLVPGDNELVVAVADAFGGWGLMGRLEPAPGVTIVDR